MLGRDVLELVKVFAAQGHSGMSASYAIALFRTVASYGMLNSLKHPMETGEYVDRSEISQGPCFQSTRKSTIFSEDGGKTWYDLDGKIPWWKKRLGIRRAYISFPH